MSGAPTGRGRRVRPQPEEQHPDERWTVSYMDMVTVLMVLFIVLFAMSTVDQQKYEELRNSLATGFGVEEAGKIDTAEGVVVPVEKIDEEGEGFTDLELAMLEVDRLRALQEAIDDDLAGKGLADTVRFKVDERGLTVRLVSSETFFEAESAGLTQQARDILDSVGAALAPAPYAVSVEGHADHRATKDFQTNWELSSARATQVVRQLVDRSAIAPGRMAAVGFGSARPLAEGDSTDVLATNRRVDVVVLSDEPEAVRALIPGLVAQG
ncbi:flagellar motor protein MotB [Georgenia sp. AZ-5]|uniref:flagellar motor protein MotB n=1 Tax=Georgenia sp. AZ-5 TaxID=3367526 RepID=UPI0037542C3C